MKQKFVTSLLLFFSMFSFAFPQNNENSNGQFVQLQLTRPELLTNPSDEEMELFQQHFGYWQQMLHEGLLLLGGPTLEGPQPPGILILQAENVEKAKEIAGNDPAVKGGLFSFTVLPMRIALLAGGEKMGMEKLDLNTAKKIEKSIIISVPVQDAWKAWTTVEGVKAFFAPDAAIELAVGGKYEMYFLPDAPEGSRGGEGLTILSFLPEKMLSFTWNAPPTFPEVRKQHSWVVIAFDSLSSQKTKVSLSHIGWKEGEEWNKVYDYFNNAWNTVLARLQYRFETGPIDWANPWRPGD